MIMTIANGEMAAFGASDAACHLYPGADQQPERAAYCRGAQDAVAVPISDLPEAAADLLDILNQGDTFPAFEAAKERVKRALSGHSA